MPRPGAGIASALGGPDAPEVDPGVGVPRVAGGGSGGGPDGAGGAAVPEALGTSGVAPQVRTASARASPGASATRIARVGQRLGTRARMLPPQGSPSLAFVRPRHAPGRPLGRGACFAQRRATCGSRASRRGLFVLPSSSRSRLRAAHGSRREPRRSRRPSFGTGDARSGLAKGRAYPPSPSKINRTSCARSNASPVLSWEAACRPVRRPSTKP
jgi:hypothetical protein